MASLLWLVLVCWISRPPFVIGCGLSSPGRSTTSSMKTWKHLPQSEWQLGLSQWLNCTWWTGGCKSSALQEYSHIIAPWLGYWSFFKSFLPWERTFFYFPQSLLLPLGPNGLQTHLTLHLRSFEVSTLYVSAVRCSDGELTSKHSPRQTTVVWFEM